MLGLPHVERILFHSVVKSWSSLQWLLLLESFHVLHLPDIPDLKELVFSVRCKVEAIALTGDVCDSFLMTNEHTSSPVVRIESSPVPDFHEAIVGTSKDEIRAFPVGPTNSIDFILMGVFHNGIDSVLHHIIDQDIASLASSQDLPSVS